MGAVAVYILNDEFKRILRETKNGMVKTFSYVLTKSVLEVPIMFLFSLFGLGIPGFFIQEINPESFWTCTMLFACCLFVWEGIAECLSVWFDNAIIGMLLFMCFWFSAFLFGGIVLPEGELYWPFKALFYILPYSYYFKSFVYSIFVDVEFASCTNMTSSAVCVNSTSGAAVLDALGVIMPIFSSKSTLVRDSVIILLIGVFFKVAYIVGVLVKTSRMSTSK